MSAFKDQVAADLATFVNVDEFAGTHSLNGSAVACILDQPAHILPGNRGQVQWEGIDERVFELRLKSADFPTPSVDQRITVDDRAAIVTFSDVTDGLLTIRGRWWDS